MSDCYFLVWKLRRGETVSECMDRVPATGLVLPATCRDVCGQLATDLPTAMIEARARLEPSEDEAILVQPVWKSAAKRRAKRYDRAWRTNSQIFGRWLKSLQEGRRL